MILSPTLKVLSMMQKHHVKALLMGGQACVLFGGAEFSRDTDLVVLVDPENILRLRRALGELQAECIAVPPFDPEYLERGHAIHFRCYHSDASRHRVDIMAKMRGVDPFPDLWNRRVTLHADDTGESYDLVSLPDLVRAKKTQREKDWPMLRRIVEVDYLENHTRPSPAQVEFWLRELRSPEILVDLARQIPQTCRRVAGLRPLLEFAATGEFESLTRELTAEMLRESAADREYWAPLKRELEQLRKDVRNQAREIT